MLCVTFVFLIVTIPLLLSIIKQGGQLPIPEPVNVKAYPTPVKSGLTPTQPVPTPNAENGVMDLQKGVETKIPNSNLIIVFREADIPGPRCYDCITVTTLQMRSGDEKKDLIYTCGGIAGICTTELNAFGFKIDLIGSPSTNLVKVKISQINKP